MRTDSGDRRDLILALAVCAASGVALFAWMFGADLPLASADFWRMPKNDMVVMLAGYEAFLNAPWSLHPLVTQGLSTQPVSIVFTDSIPWISLALKALGLGRVLNPLGLFLLLTYALQGVGMVLVLWAMGVRRFTPLVLGGLLALMAPAWIVRQIGHIALSGHFILLLALAASIQVARAGLTWRRVAALCLIAAFATGVHAYHLVPVAACVAAALLSVLLRGGWKAAAPVLASGLAILLAVAASAAFLGYGTVHDASRGAGGLDYYSMNLLGPVFPQGSGLFGQKWAGSWFTGTYDPTGGQAYEGYQYAAAGVIAALALALVLGAAKLVRGWRPSRAAVVACGPFVLAAAALTAAAIGPAVYVHMRLVLELPAPRGLLGDWMGFFPAHGRFYWLVGYLLTATAVCVLSKTLRPRVLAPIAAALVVLQACDTSPPRTAVRDIFHAPERSIWPTRLAAAPAIRNRPWVFNPTFFCLSGAPDMAALSQLSLIALRAGGQVNSAATARATHNDCGYPPEQLRDAAPGDRRITVVFNGGLTEGGRLQAFTGRSDCYRFARGVVCGRDLQDTGLIPAKGADLGLRNRPFAEIRFDTSAASSLLVQGWSQLDPGGKAIWSDGQDTAIDLPTPATLAKDAGLYVDLVLYGYSAPPNRPQPVIVMSGGQTLGRFEVEPGLFDTYRVRIPGALLDPGRPVRLRFHMPRVGPVPGDPRQLGIAIQSVKLTY